MQTQGGSDAETAILSSSRKIYHEVKVDWNRNGLFNHSLSNLTPYVDNISLDRALSGSMPEEVRLIEGSAAAELTFELGGTHINGQRWVAVTSPYNGLSPLYTLGTVGAEITYRLGVETEVGIVWYPQFIGNIRQVSPTRGDDKVVISAVDRSEKLRRPIPLTDWGMLDRQSNLLGEISSQLMYSHWLIDHCLKSCGVSSTPWTWAAPENTLYGKVLMFVSGNGSVAPNIGWVDGSSANQFFPDGYGPVMFNEFGPVHPNSPESTKKPQQFLATRNYGYDYNRWWIVDRDYMSPYILTETPPLSFVIGLTVDTNTNQGSEWYSTMTERSIVVFYPTENRRMHIRIGLGKVKLMIEHYNSTTSSYQQWSPPVLTLPPNDFVRVVAEASFYGQTRLRCFKSDGTVLSSGIVDPPAGYPVPGTAFAYYTGFVETSRQASIGDLTIGAHELNMSSFADPVIPGEAGIKAKYAAVLDRGLNRLSFLPKRRGALAWDVISEVAAAEFGSVFWDENGVFHFWNQDTMTEKKQQSVRTLTLDEVQGLNMTVLMDTVRNIAAVTAKRQRVQDRLVFETQGQDEIVAIEDPANYARMYTMWMDDIVTPNSGNPPWYLHPDAPGSNPKWNDQVTFGVLPQQYSGSPLTWRDISSTVNSTFGLFMYRGPNGEVLLRYNEGYGPVPWRFVLAETYNNSSGAVDSNGQPAFRWNGSGMTAFDDRVVTIKNTASINKHGPQGLELSGDWYQEFFNHGGMIDKLLAQTGEPVPSTDSIVIKGDPRLQLGDAIQVQDPSGFGELLQMQITGITRTFSKDNGLVDTLAVELTEPTHNGIWDSAQYGLWDNTFYWT